MTKLSDPQCILLAAAAARDNNSLLPLPDSLTGAGVTDAGRAAVNVEPHAHCAAADAKRAPAAVPATSGVRQTKATRIVELLQRQEGATLVELVEATGWLPHTARAALTGLKKKGHVIDKAKRGETTCYYILAKA